MLIYGELKNDHANIKSLLKQLIATDQSDSKSWQEQIAVIRDELVPHSRAEEAILYNSLRDIEGADGIAAHSYGEHAKAETLLRSLQVLEVVDINSITTAKKLLEVLTHHIEEEETKIFGAARKLFTQDEAAVMGEAFVKMKPKVKEESFLQTSLDLVANMMPSRFRDSFRKYTTQIPGGRYESQSLSKAS